VTAAFLLAALLCAAEVPQTDGESWNEGVEFYRAGDVTNALRVLRPLMLSRTHGARAAEVVAKLEYDRGDLEEAANAAQIALRSAPEDAKANRNFTRAADGLPRLREAKRIESILKGAQGKDPGSMMHSATCDARALMEQAGSFLTNSPERAVSLADSLSRRAQGLADAWIPVREAIVQSVTNEQQASTIVLQIDQAESKTKKAAEQFGDMDEGAYATMSDVEHDFTRFLKLTAMPPVAISEGEIAQSNAWQDVAAFNGRSWQSDALDYTRAFRAKFPAWAKAYEQQAQADTNKPPFTAEDQAKISALATELEKLQIELAEKALPPSQEKALAVIRQIRELMPKDGGGGGQNQQGNNQQQNDQEQKQQDKNQEQNNEQQQSDQKQDQDPQQQEEEKESDGQEADQQEQKDDKEVEALLKKAQERNDEHEAEKKARMRKAPLPPNERDW